MDATKLRNNIENAKFFPDYLLLVDFRAQNTFRPARASPREKEPAEPSPWSP